MRPGVWPPPCLPRPHRRAVSRPLTPAEDACPSHRIRECGRLLPIHQWRIPSRKALTQPALARLTEPSSRVLGSRWSGQTSDNPYGAILSPNRPTSRAARTAINTPAPTSSSGTSSIGTTARDADTRTAPGFSTAWSLYTPPPVPPRSRPPC